MNTASVPPAGLAAAIDLLTDRRVAVITGAGISTESGIPDYRGEGAPVRTPMTHARFLAQDDADRRRYWAGGELGWKDFSTRHPNDGHRAVARLERAGLATGVVTQNADGLHQAAGSRRVVELHGTGRRVRCLECGQVFDRRAVSERILRDNPGFGEGDAVRLGPDGDAVPADTSEFIVPDCTVCGGMLRPDVVFFGEFVPVGTFRLAEGVVAAADAVLVAGSSLVVNSATRLLERARRRALPIIVVNRGTTRWDDRASVKLDGAIGDVLPSLVDALTD